MQETPTGGRRSGVAARAAGFATRLRWMTRLSVRPVARRRCLTALLACALALGVAGPAAAQYQPGRGYQLDGGRLSIGGYASLELDLLDRTEDRLVLEDLALLLSWRPTAKIHVFAELETEELLQWRDGEMSTDEGHEEIERLYISYLTDAGGLFSVGKMLTPFGIWNVIHAQPLVWTTSRPVATRQIFDTNFTGLRYDETWELGGLVVDATLYGQPAGEFRGGNEVQQASEGGGGRLAVSEGERWTTGASFVRFRDHVEQRWETAAGIDAILRGVLWELSFEGALNEADDGETRWSAYGQVVRHLGGNLHPFLRVEHVALPGTHKTPVTAGLAWKPLGNVILKGEYIVGAHGIDDLGDGFLASVAILF
jgi:hypothetical protein